MNKIKVCHLTSVHPIDDVRIFHKECISLAKNGYDVTLIACGEREYEEIKNGVKCISLYVPVKNRLERMIKRPKAIYKKALEIDTYIYHFHDPELLPVGKKLKRKGKKVIYDAHEDLPRQILQKDWIPDSLKRSISVIFEFIENSYVKQMDAVVTVTEYIAKRFQKVAKRVIVCANYASVSEFNKIPDFNKRNNSVCYIGGISKLRGIEEVVAACEKAGITLNLAGEFENEMLKTKILANKSVNYLGYLSREGIQNILTLSFAGVVTFLPAPNHNNACPNKIFEYMASGIPVIASNFEKWIPIIEGNYAGICVNPTSIEEISNAIKYLKENPQTAIEMGKNGRRAFEEKYNWQVEEKKLLQLYNSL
jgi:glycosyltransferase involved in cell wall biosynthesis